MPDVGLAGQRSAVSADAQLSKTLAVGVCKWLPPTQEGMQARGSKEVNSFLHGYISGFSLSSVPVMLCDTGQVI